MILHYNCYKVKTKVESLARTTSSNNRWLLITAAQWVLLLSMLLIAMNVMSIEFC